MSSKESSNYPIGDGKTAKVQKKRIEINRKYAKQGQNNSNEVEMPQNLDEIELGLVFPRWMHE